MTRTKLTQASGLRRTTVRDIVKRLIERGHLHEAPNGEKIIDRGKPAFDRALKALSEALGGKLDEHAEVVWRLRMALQDIVPD